MPGLTGLDDPGQSDSGLGGRLARLRERFEAAWVAADGGGTIPDIEAYLDGFGHDEVAAARVLLESIDRARRARLGPLPSTNDALTIDTSVASSPTKPPANDPEAETLADTDVPATIGPEETVAATDVFESGRARADEPPETLPMLAEAGATIDLATTVALSSSWSNRAKGAPIPRQLIPGYEVLGELGRGGMGVVYKARQVRADRLVALKMVLAGAHAGEDQLARFAIEAQAVAHLQHPGIVQIYDVGEHAGLPYFSLEFVEGGSLSQYIAGKPQTPRRAAEIVADLADAMAAAHARNIVHRDLKPANVLLTADGRPKITDFGLAKKLEGDSEQTRSGAIMGTPSYMSPEQALGLTHEIGPAADQYALGAILYELLTGRPPFQGASAIETLELVRNDEPVPPRRLQPKVPVDLETIALKTLQKEIPKRYADSAALARDLRRYLDGEPIEARPVSFPERSWRWCRRNPRVASLYAAVASLVLIGLIGSTTAAITLNSQRLRLKEQNLALFIEQQKAKTAREIAERNEKIANLARLAESKAKLDAEEKARIALIAKQRETEAKGVAEAKEKIAKQAIDSAFEQNKAAVESVRYISVLANMRLLGIPGTRDVRAEMLNVAGKSLVANMSVLETLAPIANDKASREDAIRTMVGIHQRAGNLAVEIRRIDEASKQFELMQKGAETLLEEYPDSPRTLRNFAASSNSLGDFLLNHTGDVQRALVLYERALEARRTWLARALEKQKQEPNVKQWFDDQKSAEDGIAVNLWLVSKAWFELGDPVKARDFAIQEVEYRASYKPSPGNALKARAEHASMFKRLGDIEIRLGNREAGRDSYRKHLRLTEEMAADYPGRADVHQDLLHARQEMGSVALMYENDPAAALESYKPVLDEFREKLELDPTNGSLQDEVSRSEYYCATAYLQLHRDREAEEHYRESLKLRRELVGVDKADIDQLPFLLVLARCGEIAEAQAIADAMAAKPGLDNRTTYYVAQGYALCAGAVAKGRPVGTLSADEATAHRRFINRSYELLRGNLARGWRNPVDLEVEPDLAPLRDDPDFPKLLAEARLAAEKPR